MWLDRQFNQTFMTDIFPSAKLNPECFRIDSETEPCLGAKARLQFFFGHVVIRFSEFRHLSVAIAMMIVSPTTV